MPGRVSVQQARPPLRWPRDAQKPNPITLPILTACSLALAQAAKRLARRRRPRARRPLKRRRRRPLRRRRRQARSPSHSLKCHEAGALFDCSSAAERELHHQKGQEVRQGPDPRPTLSGSRGAARPPPPPLSPHICGRSRRLFLTAAFAAAGLHRGSTHFIELSPVGPSSCRPYVP